MENCEHSQWNCWLTRVSYVGVQWVVNLLASYFMKKWLNTLRDACIKQLEASEKQKQ